MGKLISGLLSGALCAALASRAAQNPEPQSLQIESVIANGKPIGVPRGSKATLGSFPQNSSFDFQVSIDPSNGPLRIQYQLEGYENHWHEGEGDMALSARFFNEAGDQIHQNIFKVSGQSAGWNGSLKSSSLTHRREALVVPPGASRLWITVSSAGPPDAVGIYLVADLVVSESDGNAPPKTLLQLNSQSVQIGPEQVPLGWVRDGNHASMAKIVNFGQDPASKGLAVLDDDVISHAEWRTQKEAAPAVAAGQHLIIEWNEMYSIGLGNFHGFHYSDLPPGNYRLRVRGADLLGIPTSTEASVKFVVLHPFWKRPWFWAVLFAAATAGSVAWTRYLGWHKIQREMARLKHQQELERERLRIAHDIHDDLGARVTQISLVSAMAQNNPTLTEKARADFERISTMSRDLVSALYGTVWAVNPANDNLDALGNYICQMVNQLCEHAQVRCRFHLSDLPQQVHVSSQTRHNISMAVKEAVHNVIKHAKASEISVHMTFKEGLLSISVQDDGCGFHLNGSSNGNGLNNMKQRLEGVGGSCLVSSQIDRGTTIDLRLHVPKSGDHDI